MSANIRDIVGAAKFISSAHQGETLKKLETPSSIFSICFIIYLWSMILMSWFIVAYLHWGFFPISIFICGVQQRTLRNILHDASHNSLFKNPLINEFSANLFAGLPLFEKVHYFRIGHLAHHRYLGIANKDPDYVSIEQIDPSNSKNQLQIFISAITNKKWVLSSYFGNLLVMSKKEISQVLLWWSIFIGSFSLIISFEKVLIFLLVWFLAKFTVYHLLKVYMEISDHAGRPEQGIIAYSRSLPAGIWSYIFFPFGDNYHLAHHLLPKVQTHKLKKAHKILLNWKEYQNGCFPDGYILGKYSAVKGWLEFRKK